MALLLGNCSLLRLSALMAVFSCLLTALTAVVVCLLLFWYCAYGLLLVSLGMSARLLHLLM